MTDPYVCADNQRVKASKHGTNKHGDNYRASIEAIKAWHDRTTL